MSNIQQILQSIGAHQIGSQGGMMGMAVDGTQFLKLLEQLQIQNDALAAENGVLKETLAQQGYTNPTQLPVTPQFPEGFYEYGTSPLAHIANEDEIQSAIDTLYNVFLEDGQFTEMSIGDTVVIKTRDGDVEKYIVARGYYDASLEVDYAVKDHSAPCPGSCGNFF